MNTFWMRNCHHFVTYVCNVILRMQLANTNISLFHIHTKILITITVISPHYRVFVLHVS